MLIHEVRRALRGGPCGLLTRLQPSGSRPHYALSRWFWTTKERAASILNGIS